MKETVSRFGVSSARPSNLPQSRIYAEFAGAWRIVVVGMVGISVAPIVVFQYAFSAFIAPFQSSFGWGRPAIQLAFSFFFAGITIASLAVGWLHRRFGLRRVTLTSLVGSVAVWTLFPFIGKSVWSLYLFAFCVPMLSMGTLQITWFSLTILWFEHRRGLALAAVLCGTAITATAVPSYVTWIIDRWGWQVAGASLAVFPLCISLPLTMLWFKIPAGSTNPSSKHERAPEHRFILSIREPRYWIITCATSLATACSLSIVSIAVPILRDKGISSLDAAAIVGVYGIAIFVGRLSAGYLVDRVWAPGIVSFMISLPAIACGLLASRTGPDTMLLIISMVLLGAGTGAELDSAAYLLSRYLCKDHFQRLFGTLTSCCSVACMIAPIAFGRFYQSSGTYTSTLAVSCGLFLVASSLLLTLGRYPTEENVS